jgi:DNA-binding CsgD family transcriptional regulator
MLGFSAAILILARVSGQRVKIFNIINCGYPESLVGSLRDGTDLKNRPTLARWLQERRPLIVMPPSIGTDLGVHEFADVTRHNLGCRAIHGFLDTCGTTGTYVNFAGVSIQSEENIKGQLDLLIPHLHFAMINIWRKQCLESNAVLTNRERQLLHLVSLGRTNRQIAADWNRSVATVRNLLHTLMARLGASRRSELVIIALEIGSLGVNFFSE